ncbi:hypothetical protein SK128_010390 [Halocaridina rubra]|uniref:Uncharacterized protein n=1 Tax=Halocaridina rubra TaxID=373956 RepID=A0AAN9ADU0_HALRR
MGPNLLSKEKETERPSADHGGLNSKNFKFQENNLMTQYEGYWVRKSKIRWISAMYHKYHRKASANKNLSSDIEKQGRLDRCMKKVLRNEHRMLKIELAKDDKYVTGKKLPTKGQSSRVEKTTQKQSKTQSSDVAQPWQGIRTESLSDNGTWHKPKDKKPGKYLGISTSDDPDVTKYEGFYMNKTSTAKLDKLKDKWSRNGMSAEVIRKKIKKECRKEERLFKKAKKKQITSCNQEKI